MSFPITCTACNKTFTISDEIYEKKVAGRVVTIKCKSCSHGIRVDGTKKASTAPAPTAAPAPPAPTPAAPPEPLWAVDYPDGQDREFTTSEVVAELERGVIGAATLVWRDGMAEWLELAQVPELAGELSKLEARKSTLAATKSATATPVHTPRPPMPTETGLGGLPGAEKSQPIASPAPIAARAESRAGSGFSKPRTEQPSGADLTKPRAKLPSAPDLAKPRAKLPSTPDLTKPRAKLPSAPDLAKPRAPQPSSPLIGSSPAPAAGATPLPVVAPPRRLDSPVGTPLPAPPAFAPAAPVVSPAPPPAAPATVVAAPLPVVSAPRLVTDPAPPAVAEPPLLSATATPPLPASVAKVVSRPPQTVPAFPAASGPAPAFAAVPAIVSDHATVEWPEAKSKTPMIIVGLVAAVLLGVVVFFFVGGKEQLPPPTPIAPAPANVATTKPTSLATTTSAAASQPGSETASGSDPVLAPRDPGATPGAGFAELFAAGARKAESKGATLAPTARFDPAATKQSLAQAANEAQACKQSGGPTGKVTVVVTFDPSGKVSSATITDAPFAGTPSAVCISSAFKRASIAPFSGLPGTVSKTFSVL